MFASLAQIASEPEQCLRYCFEAGAEPLWPSRKNIPEKRSIPDCPNCGAPRTFEFQVLLRGLVGVIYVLAFHHSTQTSAHQVSKPDNHPDTPQVMPQLLTHLGLDDAREDAPDFAMLAVYSCSQSCSAPDATASAYLEEYVWVQPPLK